MHQAVADFVSEQSRLYVRNGPVRILDIGGHVVSSVYYDGPHPRDLFPQAKEYLVLDQFPGEDVDFVADATRTWELPWTDMGLFDVVVCTEVLEHVNEWVNILVTAREALKTGGRLILTCAGPGRPAHPATSEELSPPFGEFYANVNHMELRKALVHVGFKDVITYQVGEDTQATAMR
jgi:SAM-dependent methyltransferase